MDTVEGLDDAARRGRLAVCADAGLSARAESIDVFVDASSAVAPALDFDSAAIETGKHVVMMNAEADLIFGPHFLDLARRRGVVCTSSDEVEEKTVLDFFRELPDGIEETLERRSRRVCGNRM